MGLFLLCQRCKMHNRFAHNNCSVIKKKDIKMNKRIETFSDGVFAIAITLLILEIKVPPVDSVHAVADVWRATGRLWPPSYP